MMLLVGLGGLEPPTSCTRNTRATNCATVRYACGQKYIA